MSVFTEREHRQNLSSNPPKDIEGSWIGSKNAMSGVALGITTDSEFHNTNQYLLLFTSYFVSRWE
jgi:hypothetical protein